MTIEHSCTPTLSELREELRMARVEIRTLREQAGVLLASNAELREALKQIEERTRLTRDKELNDIAVAALAKSDELKGGA